MADRKTALRNAVCAELEAIAFANPFDFLRIEEYDNNGETAYKLLPLTSDEITDEKKKAVESVTTSARGVEVKLHGKMKALELLGKMNGLFDEQTREEADVIPPAELDKIIIALEEKLHIPHRIFGRRKKEA